MIRNENSADGGDYCTDRNAEKAAATTQQRLNEHAHICLKDLKEMIRGFEDDKCIVRLALKKNSHAIRLASRRIQDYKEFVLSIISNDNIPDVFCDISEQLRDDKDVVKLVIKKKPDLIQYASFNCRDDPDTMLLSIERLSSTICYSSERLLDDRQFILALLQRKHDNARLVMKHASERIRDDKIIMMIVVQSNGMGLESASMRLRRDREIAFAAIVSNSYATAYVPRKFLDDKEFMKAAIQRNQYLVQYVSSNLRDDREFILWALKNVRPYNFIRYASTRFRDDIDLVKEALVKNGRLARFVSPRIRDDRQAMMLAVQNDGAALRYASPRLQEDMDVVSAALERDIENNFEVIQDVSKRLLDNEEFALKVIKQQQKANIKSQARGGEMLQFMSMKIRSNRKVVMAAVTCNDGQGLQYASPALKNDLQVVLQSVTAKASSFQFASKAMRENPQIVAKALLNYDYPPNSVSDFLIFYCDDGIKNDLASTVRFLRKRQEETNRPINFHDLPSVLSYAESWSASVWEYIWLANRLVASDPDAARNLVEFTGVKEQFSRLRRLRHTAPVIGAIAEKGTAWQDLSLLPL